jgi:hypothetical protein
MGFADIVGKVSLDNLAANFQELPADLQSNDGSRNEN